PRDPTQLAQTLHERIVERIGGYGGTDPENLPGLLPLGSDRRGEEAARDGRHESPAGPMVRAARQARPTFLDSHPGSSLRRWGCRESSRGGLCAEFPSEPRTHAGARPSRVWDPSQGPRRPGLAGFRFEAVWWHYRWHLELHPPA